MLVGKFIGQFRYLTAINDGKNAKGKQIKAHASSMDKQKWKKTRNGRMAEAKARKNAHKFRRANRMDP